MILVLLFSYLPGNLLISSPCKGLHEQSRMAPCCAVAASRPWPVTDVRDLLDPRLGLEGVAGQFSALGGIAPVDERNRLSLRLDYDLDGVVLPGVGHHLEAQTGLGKA